MNKQIMTHVERMEFVKKTIGPEWEYIADNVVCAIVDRWEDDAMNTFADGHARGYAAREQALGA